MKNRHPSYPTILNLSLMKSSDDFHDNFGDLIQTTDRLFPSSKEKLNEKVSLFNKALMAAAEDNLKPRERIDRTFVMTNKIKENLTKGTN